MTPDATELSLLDRFQRDFPLAARPFALAGQSVDLGEAATIGIFERLQAAGVISRIGAVVRPQTVGASTLAAMRVPQERLEEVAAIVSAEDCVNHNYARTHDINLWFVVAGPDDAAVGDAIARIEHASGLGVMRLPLVEAYHLDLGFSLDRERPRRAQENGGPVADYRPSALERDLLAAIEDGLPLVARPYHDIAARLGVSEATVLESLRRLVAGGVVSRFGCVVRHRALGYTANAMTVWDIPDDRVSGIGRVLADEQGVTLCYRRPRRPPDWPYNLFCMVHARTREAALEVIDRLNRVAGIGAFPQDVLFSTRCFKQRGAKFSRTTGAVH